MTLVRQCTGKARYTSAATAHAARAHVPGGNRLEAYPCGSCGGFHLGNPKRRYRRLDFRLRHADELEYRHVQRRRTSRTEAARARRRRRRPNAEDRCR